MQIFECDIFDLDEMQIGMQCVGEVERYFVGIGDVEFDIDVVGFDYQCDFGLEGMWLECLCFFVI